jgi:hypothetical protein
VYKSQPRQRANAISLVCAQDDYDRIQGYEALQPKSLAQSTARLRILLDAMLRAKRPPGNIDTTFPLNADLASQLHRENVATTPGLRHISVEEFPT